MHIFFIILLCFFIIVLLPFPLKLNITLENKELKIYFFKFLLFPKKKKEEKKKVQKKKKKTSKAKISSSNITTESLRSLYKALNKNRFKPKLKFYFSMEYSLNDAAYTALSIAPAYDMAMFFINALDVPFKVKVESLTLTPIFKDKFLIKLNFTSIIWTNLAKLIYVSILTLVKLKK